MVWLERHLQGCGRGTQRVVQRARRFQGRVDENQKLCMRKLSKITKGSLLAMNVGWGYGAVDGDAGRKECMLGGL